MKKAVVLIMTIFLCFVACEKREKPENLIPKQKMEAILYDLYIISAAKGVNKKLLEQNGLNPSEYILNKYQVDSAQFAVSNNYYTYFPKEYMEMVDSVKSRLEKEKVIYEELKKEEDKNRKLLRDSVNKKNKKGEDLIDIDDSKKLEIKKKI